jgi:hypothetical protein
VQRAHSQRNVSLSIAEYDKVIDFRRAHPNATLKEVNTATGVNISTFRSWDRSRPREVTRRDDLLILQQLYLVPDPNCFHSILNAAPHLSRRLARSLACEGGDVPSKDLRPSYSQRDTDGLDEDLEDCQRLPSSLTDAMAARLAWLIERTQQVANAPAEKLDDENMQVETIPNHAKVPSSPLLEQARTLAPSVAIWCSRRMNLSAISLTPDDLVSSSIESVIRLVERKFTDRQELGTALMVTILKHAMLREVTRMNPRKGAAYRIARELIHLKQSLTVEEVMRLYSCRRHTAVRALEFGAPADFSMDSGRSDRDSSHDLAYDMDSGQSDRDSSHDLAYDNRPSSNSTELLDIVATVATPFERLLLGLRNDHQLSFVDIAFVCDISADRVRAAWKRFQKKVQRAL